MMSQDCHFERNIAMPRTVLGFAILSLLTLSACAPQKPAAPTQPESITPAKEAPPPSEPADIRSITQIDFASYDRELAKLIGLEIGESLPEAKAKLETYFVPGKGIPGEESTQNLRRGPAEVSFSTFGADGGSVIIAERSEMADDSVRAQRLYALTKKKADGSEMLIDYGIKNKCWRGESKNTWTKSPCP